MQRIIATSILLAMLLRGATSNAQEVQNIPEGDDRITAVRRGDPAPYEGQLFDNPTALRWGNWLLQYKLRLKADVELEKKKHEADISLWTQRLELSEKKYSEVSADYQRQVAFWHTEADRYRQDALNPPWYKTPAFNVAVGAFCTLALVSVTGYALNASK